MVVQYVFFLSVKNKNNVSNLGRGGNNIIVKMYVYVDEVEFWKGFEDDYILENFIRCSWCLILGNLNQLEYLINQKFLYFFCYIFGVFYYKNNIYKVIMKFCSVLCV